MDDVKSLREHVAALIEEYDLDHGNAEVYYWQSDPAPGGLYVSVEAPNHATVGTWIGVGVSEEELRRELAERMREFDADEEFNEMWSPKFGDHNGFTPSEFMGMLQEDMAFFRETAARLSGSPSERDTVLAEVRWTDQDLRYLLMRHQLPVTDGNVDAMRRMLDEQELQRRSISHGWEVIESMIDWDRLDRDPQPTEAGQKDTADATDGRTDDVGLLTDPADPMGLALDVSGVDDGRILR